MELENTIRKYVLQNAIKFNGKANPGAIMGKVLGEDPSLRSKGKEVNQMILAIVKEVNALGVERQTELLTDLAPKLLEKKEHKEKDIYAFLDINDDDKIVTAFPPEPSKYPHIGHAKSLLLNYELAKRYNGRFQLRFDDTNPDLAKEEFYDIHKDNYKWLGIQWDEMLIASDYMEKFYELAEKLVKDGNAYMCQCQSEQIKDARMKGIGCRCREKTPDENLDEWHRMGEMEEGSIILRMKINMAHKNSTMRDPAIMRIMDKPHAMTGEKYRVWPNYDFETTVMDALCGVTHRLRTKEFELRNELQRHIQRTLGFKETFYYELARFNMTGVLSSGRAIRDMIEKGELVGWDDPSLTTLVALRRRGFLPKALLDFVRSTGMTKNEATLTWDDLILHNRRLLEESADRFFFVEDPESIEIKGAPAQDIEMDLHPDHRKGGRKMKTNSRFYVTKNDLASLPDGKMSRLMDCVNFIKKRDSYAFDSTEHTRFRGSDGKIIHWVAASDDLISVEVMMPDKSVRKGFAEPGVASVNVGDVIQFERFGFCRLDSVDGEVRKFWYTHK